MTSRSRVLLLGVALAVLAGLGWVVNQRLVIGTDLRLFMPSPQTPQERLILEEIGDGPASRMLLVGIEGADAAKVALASARLASSLRVSPRYTFVANGPVDASAIDERFLPYRYLLSPGLDHARLDEHTLTLALEERGRDLSSPAAAMIEPWIARDPTLESLTLLDSWLPQKQPRLLHEVWFDAAGKEALLVVQTRASGFDPNGQRAAQAELRRAFEEARADSSQRLHVSGPGAFTVLMQERTQGEAQTLGTLATVGMVVLLLVAYRSLHLLLLGLLPLAAAGVAGLAVVGLTFGTVHGITLAFGFTLIGVAQDYPLHLFSHQHAGIDPQRNARSIWPALATGVASTCVAYLAFLLSGVLGLAQLAVFTVTGLLMAGLSTRYVLPHLMPDSVRDAADSRFLQGIWQTVTRLPRSQWLGLPLALACCAYLILSPRPLWQDELGGLTPIPRELIQRDIAMRQSLGAPDVRHVMVIEADDAETALQRSLDADAGLRAAGAAGALDGYDHAGRYLATRTVQERRRAALPTESELRAALAAAAERTDFVPEAFEPFVADVAQARSLPALDPANLSGTPLEARVGTLLFRSGHGWIATVTLSGVHDAAHLERVAADVPGATFIDLKQASESLVAHQRARILGCLAVAALLLVVVVAVALKDRTRVRRVLTPMALTTLVVVTALHGAGIALSLFHLIALVLAAGLGLDYALFFEHVEDDPADQNRTLHAVLVCALSTLMVFVLLSLSSLPVLRAIGVTVSIGVVSNFFLALWLVRPGEAPSDAR